MVDFEELVEQYQPMIYRIMQSLHIYNRKEEFYQHGLIALWEASQRYNSEKGSFVGYAYSYIRGSLLMELRRTYAEMEKCLYPDEDFWGMMEDFHSPSPFEKETLLSYCTTMSENQRKWVLYTFLDGLLLREIAEREKVSISAVKNWGMGAREKLRKLFTGD